MRPVGPLFVALSCLGGCTQIEELVDGLPWIGDGDGEEPEEGEDGAIRVDSVNELIAALGPNRTIELEPGEYVFLDASLQERLPKGTKLASYDELSEHYEAGRISGVKNLRLVGLGDGAKIVMPDYERVVLDLWNVEGLRLQNLTLGHSGASPGCNQGVVRLVGAKDVRFEDLELFGSGAEGVVLVQSENVHISDSRIFDCGLRLSTFVESKDILIEDTVFENNGSDAVSFLETGFVVNQSSVAFENVTVANNVSELTEELFTIDDGDPWGVPSKDERPEVVDAPKKSTVTFEGGAITNNRFGAPGVKGHDVTFTSTQWSGNTMLAPPGAEEKGQPPPLVLGYVRMYSGKIESDGPYYKVELDSTALPLAKIEPGTEVLVRSICEYGDELIVDESVLVGSHRGKQLHELEIGKKVDLETMLYRFGLREELKNCQMSFRLGSPAGGPTIPLGTHCWTGGTKSSGECQPPLRAAAMSGVEKPISIERLDVREVSEPDGQVAVRADIVAKLQDAAAAEAGVEVKAVCKVGDKKMAELVAFGLQLPGRGRLDAGEAVVLATDVFAMHSFMLDASPQYCDFQFVALVGSSYFSRSRKQVHEACWRSGEVSEGPCESSKTAAVAPSAPSSDSVTLSDVELEIADWYAGHDSFIIGLRADATIDKPVTEGVGLAVEMRCRVKGKTRSEAGYVSTQMLASLAQGETTAVAHMAFSGEPLAAKPASCTAKFLLETARHGSPAKPIPVGKWCWNGGTTRRC